VTELHGVFWTDEIEDLRRVERRSVLARARRLSSAPGRSVARALQLARWSAADGDLDAALEWSLAAQRADPASTEATSLAASARLARSIARGRSEDLLDAAEWLAAERSDAASRCNRVRALARLGLPYRVGQLLATCPCRCADEERLLARSEWDGRRHSANDLPPEELEAVERLLGASDAASAEARFRARSQAWRVYFEREALKSWLDAPVAEQRAVAARHLRLAAGFATATGNAAPRLLFSKLDQLDAGRRAASASAAVASWLAGSAALDRYLAERAAAELSRARSHALAAALPLTAAIDVGLATTRFHLGDNAGMLAAARRVRATHREQEAPWAWARSYLLESVALQAEADWEASVLRARESERRFEAIGEFASASWLASIRAYGALSMGDDRGAEEAFLEAVAKALRAGETRYLAGALGLFARHQTRSGRPRLAVELMRESIRFETADGAAQLIAEAEAYLAEQLLRVADEPGAVRALARARRAIERIESEAQRRRATGILLHVEALRLLERAPREAIDAVTRFLDTAEAFGERFYRAESLLLRARAAIAAGERAAGERDLTAALAEIARQSADLSERARTVELLDRAREALEELVALLLVEEPAGHRALRWVEQLRGDQLVHGLAGGRRSRGDGRSPRLPLGLCATEYFSLARELLAWTVCGGREPVLVRVPVEREILVGALQRLRAAGVAGDLGGLRTSGAAAAEYLLRPIEKLLAGSVSWIVIPDALLPPIPYPWLGTDRGFLFETRRVASAPSLENLGSSGVGKDPWRSIRAFGDPAPAEEEPSVPRLPFAAREVEELATEFVRSDVARGSAATWTRFARGARRFDVLHFAGHVSTGSRTSLGARANFAPEPGRPDGRVAAEEVAELDLAGNRLAVVAACSSSTGKPARLAGTLDFARAFLLAGSERVVATLWDVSDRELAAALAEFYDGLHSGLDPEDALAQLWSRGLARGTEPRELSARVALQLTTARGRGVERGGGS
jgi:hypothetical protein